MKNINLLKKLHSESGMTLVEVMVASALLSISILGLSEINTLSLKNSKSLNDYLNWYNEISSLKQIYSDPANCYNMFKNAATYTIVTSTPPSMSLQAQLTITQPALGYPTLNCLGTARTTAGCDNPYMTLGASTRGFHPTSIGIYSFDEDHLGFHAYAPPSLPAPASVAVDLPSTTVYAFPVYLGISAERDPASLSIGPKVLLSGAKLTGPDPTTDTDGDPTHPNSVYLTFYFDIASSTFLGCSTAAPFHDIPSGAILPFTTRTPALVSGPISCPSGWLDYTPANGKLLLGAGNNNTTPVIHRVGETGGSVSRILDRYQRETPQHRHTFTYIQPGDRCEFAICSGGFSGCDTLTDGTDNGSTTYDIPTDFAGGHTSYDNDSASPSPYLGMNHWLGTPPSTPSVSDIVTDPHNHLPPYYVVKWCQKTNQ